MTEKKEEVKKQDRINHKKVLLTVLPVKRGSGNCQTEKQGGREETQREDEPIASSTCWIAVQKNVSDTRTIAIKKLLWKYTNGRVAKFVTQKVRKSFQPTWPRLPRDCKCSVPGGWGRLGGKIITYDHEQRNEEDEAINKIDI